MNAHTRLNSFDPIPTYVNGKGAMLLFIEQKCQEHGVTLKAFRGPSKKVKISQIRQSVVFDLAVAFPKAGAIAIGRVIKRDHSSVHNSLKKEAARRDVPVPVTRWVGSYNLPQIMADRESGMSISQIAQKHGYCNWTIKKLIRANQARGK